MSEEARTTGPTSRLERLARRAGAIIVFERLWPVAIWVASIFALFLAASWLGLWLELPRAGRIVGVLVFVLALAAALVPLVRFRTPSRRERLARLDRDAGLPHRLEGAGRGEPEPAGQAALVVQRPEGAPHLLKCCQRGGCLVGRTPHRQRRRAGNLVAVSPADRVTGCR